MVSLSAALTSGELFFSERVRVSVWIDPIPHDATGFLDEALAESLFAFR